MENLNLPDYPCTKCGQCCLHIKKILDSKPNSNTLIESLIKEFPYQANEQGACEMLVDGKCKVYENRPLLCNIKKISELFYSTDPVAHYLDCAQVCNMLIKHAGLDSSYIIDVEKLKTLQQNGRF